MFLTAEIRHSMKGENSMKKLTAILLALAMVLCFAACGGKDEPATTEATPEEVSDAINEAASDVSEAASEAASDVSEAASEAASDVSEAASETASEATSVAAPTTKAEILALYNSAVNSAFDAKAGFKKERYCDNENMDAGFALTAFKSLVYQFMGIGGDNKYTENVTKGNWESEAKKNYLRKSTLTEADLTGATCTLKGDKYEIVLNIKGGSSVGSKDSKTNTAPVDKSGICVGTEDKSYFDHKTGIVIYDAIDDTFSGAKISEKYSNAKATATVDAATGKLVKLVVEYDISCDMDVGIPGGKGTATGRTHIIFNEVTY